MSTSTALERHTAQLAEQINARTAEFAAALPKGVTIEQLKQDALNCINATPALVTCYTPTVLGALMTCAQLGLRPGVAGLGHAWLLPMKNWREKRTDATLIIGYRGYAELGYRHPRVVGISSNIVRQGDLFEIDLGAKTVTHQLPPLGTPRGRPLGFYATADIQGPHGTNLIIAEPMSLEEMQEHRDKYAMAKNKNGIVGPWKDHFEEMARKTMIRARLVKMMPVALELNVGMMVDEGVRTNLDPDADPVEVTERPAPEDDETGSGGPATVQPAETVRESVTLTRPAQTAQPEAPAPGGINSGQSSRIAALMRERGITTADAALDVVHSVIGRRVPSRQMTADEAGKVIAALEAMPVPTLEGEVAPKDQRPTLAEPVQDPAPPAQTAGPATDDQLRQLNILFTECGVTHHTGKGSKAKNDTERFAWLERTIGAKVASTKDLTAEQVERAIAILTEGKVGLAQRRTELITTIGRLFAGIGITDADDQFRDVSAILGRVVTTPADLTVNELADLAALLTDTQGKVAAWNAAVDAAEKANRDAAQTSGTATE
ncbi:hypothetical protein GCM10010466_39570 [Planomonospora alba]|uniref:RecT-like ssDNA binding protein n=1 Tax=Planomonospora alba TaxID=161354 RepID=A0ABP6NDB1_9ACTN